MERRTDLLMAQAFRWFCGDNIYCVRGHGCRASSCRILSDAQRRTIAIQERNSLRVFCQQAEGPLDAGGGVKMDGS